MSIRLFNHRLAGLLLTMVTVVALLTGRAASASADPNPILHIQNAWSYLCARVPYASTAPSAPIDQDTCVNKTNREWRWSPYYGSDRRLVNVHSGLCLTYFGPGHADGTAVQYPCSTTNQHQLWYEQGVVSDPWNSWHLLYNPAANRCLAPSGNSGEEYARLVLTTCNYSNSNQRWQLTTAPIGF